MALPTAGQSCSKRLRENRRTSAPFLKASNLMPSSFLSKIHSGPVKRSWVSVAAIGTSHSGKGTNEIMTQRTPRTPASWPAGLR